ncbi:MAG: hypothetical protein ACI8QD_001199 [Cyclobacteriaceae bacterium]|jgi:hypothetical protein
MTINTLLAVLAFSVLQPSDSTQSMQWLQASWEKAQKIENFNFDYQEKVYLVSSNGSKITQLLKHKVTDGSLSSPLKQRLRMADYMFSYHGHDFYFLNNKSSTTSPSSETYPYSSAE